MVEFFENIYFKFKDFWWHLFFGVLTVCLSVGMHFVCSEIFVVGSMAFYLAWIGITVIGVVLFSVIENAKVIEFVDKMYLKYKEFVWYMIFGVLTTIINLVTYYILDFIFGAGKYLYLIWTAIAWFTSVIFAYVTNKKYVFESDATDASDIKREFISFVGCRALSGVMDLAFMFITVSLFMFPSNLMKLLSNVIVVILNYIFSKLFVFKK